MPFTAGRGGTGDVSALAVPGAMAAKAVETQIIMAAAQRLTRET
ncbi:MAG TPA: hypothetical protein VGK74_16230 [Symbiobacteriaceae bacterium]